jgi:hypothetical protein
VRQQIQMLGFYLAGFLCLVLAVLKLTIEVHWWRVLLPLWVVLGHNALYITVGLVWLFFADDVSGAIKGSHIRRGTREPSTPPSFARHTTTPTA